MLYVVDVGGVLHGVEHVVDVGSTVEFEEVEGEGFEAVGEGFEGSEFLGGGEVLGEGLLKPSTVIQQVKYIK